MSHMKKKGKRFYNEKIKEEKEKKRKRKK